MHDQHMMEFIGASLAMPAIGMGMWALGASPAVLGITSIAAPMYLLRYFLNIT